MNTIRQITGNIRILLSRFNEALRGFIQKHNSDLTVRELKYLLVIFDHEGERKTDIVEHLGVTKSTVSNIIKYLIQKGYITQKTSKEDSRSKILSVTAKGHKVKPALYKYLDATLKPLESRLTKKETSELLRLMNIISK